MTIKQVALRTGVSIDNLRYYERVGLLPQVPRNDTGMREYDECAVQWIACIMKFKKAGISVETMKAYTALAFSEADVQNKRQAVLHEIRHDLQRRIQLLQECLDITCMSLPRDCRQSE